MSAGAGARFLAVKEEPNARLRRSCLNTGVSVKKLEEYLQHATECRDMAQAAPPHHREQLLEMAKTWEQLAEARRHQVNKLKLHSS
jgi:DNA-binding transcriptional MerR regulator